VQTKQQRIEELEREKERLEQRVHDLIVARDEDLALFDQEAKRLLEANDALIERIDTVQAQLSFVLQTLSAIAFYGGNNGDVPALIATAALTEFGVDLERRRVGDESR
jgi:uncharacterized protein YaaN involved in tellurite resistance